MDADAIRASLPRADLRSSGRGPDRPGLGHAERARRTPGRERLRGAPARPGRPRPHPPDTGGRRGEGIHLYLDDLSTALAADWLREHRRRSPQATNPHLLITSQIYRHPASPRITYCAMRAAFDQIGLLPRQVRADRVLDEARQSADPVHLVHLFGIHPSIAVKYVHAAHPDKALPRIRRPSLDETGRISSEQGRACKFLFLHPLYKKLYIGRMRQ